MRATLLLRQDHDELRGLVARLRDQSGPDSRLERFRELAAGLILHDQAEERFFYPALEDAGDAEADRLVREARFEHARVEDLIELLIGTDGRDWAFDRGVTELGRVVLEHLREEEVRIFPLAEQLIEARLEPLGRAIEQWRSRFEAAA
jgi:hemerythrin superfamily protein